MQKREKREVYELFAMRLKQALARKGYTQTKLANSVDLTKAMISLYVSGKSMPQYVHLCNIAQALNVCPAWLMGAEVNMDGTTEKIVNKDDQQIREWLTTSSPDQIALLRGIFEVIRRENGQKDG